MKGVKTWMTTQWNKDDLFYVCSMIEFVARETHNKVKDVVGKMTDEDLVHQLRTAGVNHCLSFEQVCDEWIEEYQITEGNFDNITTNEVSDGKYELVIDNNFVLDTRAWDDFNSVIDNVNSIEEYIKKRESEKEYE